MRTAASKYKLRAGVVKYKLGPGARAKGRGKYIYPILHLMKEKIQVIPLLYVRQ